MRIQEALRKRLRKLRKWWRENWMAVAVAVAMFALTVLFMGCIAQFSDFN